MPSNQLSINAIQRRKTVKSLKFIKERIKGVPTVKRKIQFMNDDSFREKLKNESIGESQILREFED